MKIPEVFTFTKENLGWGDKPWRLVKTRYCYDYHAWDGGISKNWCGHDDIRNVINNTSAWVIPFKTVIKEQYKEWLWNDLLNE